MKFVGTHSTFSCGSDGKASAYNVGELGSIPGLGSSPGEGNVILLQYFGLENPMDRVTWQTAVQGVAKSQTRLSNYTHISAKQEEVPSCLVAVSLLLLFLLEFHIEISYSI